LVIIAREHLLFTRQPEFVESTDDPMAKRSKQKTSRPQQGGGAKETNVPVSKQTAGGVTGAVLGAVVGGPIGAIAGGVTGAMVGDASAKGKKPMKRAAEAVQSEVTGGRLGNAMKNVVGRIKAMRTSKKKATTRKKSKGSSGGGKKKSKSMPAKKAKSAKTAKGAKKGKKKGAKKKR